MTIAFTECLQVVENQSFGKLAPMSPLGRYVKLNIAATMCRTEICVVHSWLLAAKLYFIGLQETGKLIYLT